MKKFFHLHLVSDATGETLSAIANSVTVQFPSVQPIQHVYPFVRSKKELADVIRRIESEPGIVFFTIIDGKIRQILENSCKNMNIPAIPVLDKTFSMLRAYLGAESIPKIGGQHRTNEDYFDRIEAMAFSMSHDDGQLIHDINSAQIVLVGVSRTSKTPTSIYLANRGYKVANVPLVKDISLPQPVYEAEIPLILCLTASPEYIIQIRKSRLKSLNVNSETSYIDKRSVIEEIRNLNEIAAMNDWPVIEVTRRSIEEISAAILKIYHDRS